jgi:hypothetical protein
VLKYSKNGDRRLAGLELRRKWMGKQIVFCVLFLVGFQGIVKNTSKVMGRGTRMVSLRHGCVRGVSVVRVEKKMVYSWISTVYGRRWVMIK